VSARTVAGYLVGIAIGSMSITLLFLGMRAVMDVGGACADGGPYVTAQPCPTGVPVAMLAAMLGLFAAAGLIMWFGSRIGGMAPAVVALGWPVLFIALGWNFLDYAFHAPDGEPGPVWGWLIPGVLFILIGAAPVVVAVWGWREARHGGEGRSTRLANRLTTAATPWPPRDAAGAQAIVFPTDPAARPTETAWTSTAFAPTHGSAGSAIPAGATLVDDLESLARLHDAGDLDDEEYARAKRDRLAAAEGTP
jgi:hypothetical protein